MRVTPSVGPQLSHETHLLTAQYLIGKSSGTLANRLFVSTGGPSHQFTGPNLANFTVQYTGVQHNKHNGGSPMEVADVEEFLNAFLNLDIAMRPRPTRSFARSPAAGAS